MAMKYFTPVKNILPTDYKQYLIDHFWRHESSHQDYRENLSLRDIKRYWRKEENIKTIYDEKGYTDYQIVKDNIKLIIDKAKYFPKLVNGDMRADIISLFINAVNLNADRTQMNEFIKRLEDRINLHDGYTVSEDVGDQNWSRFHTNETNPAIMNNSEKLTEFANLYKADVWCFLHTAGSGVTIAKHTDPERKATITFPLEPELPIYRNLSYYESFEAEEPACIVDYNKINTCVLLNNKEVHSIADGDPSLSNKTTLCFQVSYFKQSYSEVREMLHNDGMLIDDQ